MKTFTYQRATSPLKLRGRRRSPEGKRSLHCRWTNLRLDETRDRNTGTLDDVNGLALDTIESLPDGGLRIGPWFAIPIWRPTSVSAVTMAFYRELSRGIRSPGNKATTAGNLLQRTRCPYFYDTNLP